MGKMKCLLILFIFISAVCTRIIEKRTEPAPDPELVDMHLKSVEILDLILQSALKVPSDKYEKRITKVIDTNENGFLERPELMQWLTDVHRKLNEKSNQILFDSVDLNMDGFISWSEYLGDIPASDKHEEQTEDSDVEKYLDADKNLDFNLDRDEFDTILYGPFSDSESDLLPLIAVQVLKLDINEDGGISINELLDYGTYREDVWKKVQKIFQKCDEDGNGVLERGELLMWQTIGYLCNAPKRILGIISPKHEVSNNVLDEPTINSRKKESHFWGNLFDDDMGKDYEEDSETGPFFL